MNLPPKEKKDMDIFTTWTEANCHWQKEYDFLQQMYTEACLLWYEKWQEYEEAFAHYVEC